MEEKKAVTEKPWDEFQATGLMWWVNTMLHMFGWALVYELEEEKIVRVFPARVIWRGFSEPVVNEGYQKVTNYLKENISELQKEANDE